MNTVKWQEIKEHKVMEGLFGKFFHSKTMTIVQWRFDEGASLPSHNHVQEQITMIVEGTLELTIGESINTLTSGEMVAIPSGISHGGKAKEKTLALDIFHPVREDFREKYG